MISLTVNGTEHSVDVNSDMRLLWVLRDILGLTGTKFGCGMSLCGACTVHLDGEPVRSCVMPVAIAAGKNITTIEGLSPDGSHPLTAGLGCTSSAAVRVLSDRHDYVGRGAAQEKAPAE